MTTKQVAEAIRTNVNRWQDRSITFDEFHAEQIRLWDYAQGRSQRFSDMVARSVMPPFAAMSAECGLIGTH